MVESDDLLKLAMEGRPLIEQRALLRQGFLERGLQEWLVDAVMAEVVDGVILLPTDKATGSRVGGAGRVRLPTGVAWPRSFGEPLTFLFEIELAEIVGLSQRPNAPTSGTLLIFHNDSNGNWASYLSATRVLHRAPGDPGVLTTEGAGYEQQPLGQRNLAGYATPLVDTADYLYLALSKLGEEVLDDSWDELREQVISVLLAHAYSAQRFLGPAAAYQNPLADVIADWFSRPEAEEDRRHFSESELRGEGWSLLLQPGGISDPDSGLELEWQVAGERFYVIPTSDLQAGRFDRVITVFEG